MALGFESLQQLVEEDKLTTIGNQMLSMGI